MMDFHLWNHVYFLIICANIASALFLSFSMHDKLNTLAKQIRISKKDKIVRNALMYDLTLTYAHIKFPQLIYSAATITWITRGLIYDINPLNPYGTGDITPIMWVCIVIMLAMALQTFVRSFVILLHADVLLPILRVIRKDNA